MSASWLAPVSVPAELPGAAVRDDAQPLRLDDLLTDFLRYSAKQALDQTNRMGTTTV